MSLTSADLLAQTRASIREIALDELRRRLEAREELVLVDVREKEEFRAGHVPGAVSVPRGFLELQIEAKVPDRQAKLVVMCAGGVRSALAAATLQSMAPVC